MRLSERFSQLVPSCHDLPLPTRGLQWFQYELQQRSQVIAHGMVQSTGVTDVIPPLHTSTARLRRRNSSRSGHYLCATERLPMHVPQLDL